MARMLNASTLRVETMTIDVAGTAEQPTTFPVPDGIEVVILAHRDNVGIIKVGNSAANAQAAAGVGNIPLAQNQSVSFQLTNPNLLFVDATVAGERAIVFFET